MTKQFSVSLFLALAIIPVIFFSPGLTLGAQAVSPETGRFFAAVQSGNIDGASSALRNVDVNVQAPDGTSALHIAAQVKNPAMVDFLLSQGASHSLRNRMNMAPLHLCTRTNDVESARYLLRAGADVNVKGFTSRDGSAESTPLILASEMGSYEMVAYLIENGANVNYVNNFNRTALFWAKKARKNDVADYLESKGAVTDIDEAHDLSDKFENDAKAASDAKAAALAKSAAEAKALADVKSAAEAKALAAAKSLSDAKALADAKSTANGKSATNDSDDDGSSWEVEPELYNTEPDLSKDPTVLTKQGIRAKRNKNFYDARKYLEAAVAINGDKLLARAHLCLTYLALNQRKEAIEQYKVVKTMNAKVAKKLRKAIEKSKKY